jgi:hypothetical protein
MAVFLPIAPSGSLIIVGSSLTAKFRFASGGGNDGMASLHGSR